MPLRRAYYRRKRVYGQAARLGMSDAKKALAIARATAALLNVEHKVHSFQVSQNVSSTGSVVSISDIAQGDTSASRDGNSIRLKSLQVRSTATTNNTANTSSSVLRWLVVKDNDNQGELPAVADIIEAANVRANMNVLAYPNRFNVIMDKTICMNKDYTTQAKKACWDRYKKLNFHLKFSSSGTNDYKDNALFLVLVSDEATYQPSCVSEFRLRFIDN